MTPPPSLDSWVVALSRMQLDSPTPRDSDSVVKANIAAFARRDGSQDTDAVPRLYKIMDRPHRIPGAPAPIQDIYVSLCSCISCKIQRERRAVKYPSQFGLGRPFAPRASTVGNRCLTHGLDTACAMCVKRVTEGAESVGTSGSDVELYDFFLLIICSPSWIVYDRLVGAAAYPS
ncbi:hypothetical protein AURDEDRAFT_155225 [Auricularia subglabra TFB-10046 SS5]|nr:hypothetical protein AURDEDRAFT_155225 [Auricularia subglabra TFB-10046 SS5]